MERIDHIYVVKIGGCRFVSNVYGVFERQIPDRESLEFRVARFDSASVVVIQLTETRCHFTAPGSRCGYDDKFALGFYVVVFTVSLVADDVRHVVGVPFDRIMTIGFFTPSDLSLCSN